MHQILFLGGYDAVQKSIVVERDISEVMQRVFADGTCSPTKRRRNSVVFVHDVGSPYWFAQTIFIFHLDLDEPNLKEKEFAFVQCFYVTFLVDEIYKKLNCV